jgi:hypothetical protein
LIRPIGAGRSVSVTWTEEQLAALPVKDGVRQRGVEMTRLGVAQNLLLGATGVVSALWAVVLPAEIGMFAGFWYMTLPLTMPLMAVRYEKKAEALK